MRKFKLGAVALALALTTALPVEVPYTAGLIGTPAAEAGVLGSIKGAAKKVGGAAKDVGKVYKNFATDTAKHVKRSAPTIGRKVSGAAKTVGRNAKLWGKHAATGAGDIGKAAGKGVVKGIVAIQKPFTGFDGKFNPPGLGPNLKQPLPKPPNAGAGSWGGNAGRSAVAHRHRR